MGSPCISGEAIAEAARDVVGVRFRHQGRDPATGLDCIGVALHSGREAGWEPNNPERLEKLDYRRREDGALLMSALEEECWCLGEDWRDSLQPGDLIAMRGDFSDDDTVRHIAVVESIREFDLGGVPAPVPYIIHADARRRKVVHHNLDDVYEKLFLGAYRLRGVETASSE